MELVYLWVEDYKNIKKQRFNFSPKFHCEFKDEYDADGKLKDSCELTIDKNDDYIPNFFGDNINVTAIVGKNGSGKSNVLEFVFNKHKNIRSKEHFFIIYQDEKLQLYFFQLGYLKLIKDINTDTLCSMSSLRQEIGDTRIEYEFSSIFFSNLYQDLPIHDNTDKNHIDISTSYLIYQYSKDEEKKELLSFKYQYNLYKSKSIENAILMLKKEGIILPFTAPKQLNINVKNLYIDEDEKDILLKEFQRLRGKEDERRTQFYQYVVEVIIYKYCSVQDNDYSDIQDILKDEQANNIDDLYGKIQKDITRLFPEINIFLEKIKKLQGDKHYTDFLLSLDVKNIDVDFIKTMWSMSNSLFNTFDILHFNWKPDLSTGQEALLFQFANFYIEFKNLKQKNILILIDEGETTLHPHWQKLYISYIIQFLSDNFSNKKFHIILTSHSPFLLSDIPKQNIIFLDKDENEHCKVVDGLKEKKQTFGANIHTLLSDSFFMEDGLMGEFAKSKIEEVIDYLNNKESPIKDNDEAQKLIDIIGEPIIRNQLQKMLDSKRLLKIDEIDSIKTEIADLEKRLKDIENADDKS